MNRILLVGVARSGTTWVGNVLSKCKDTVWRDEPDDERRFSRAVEAKRYLTRYPFIAPGDNGRVGMADIEPYRELWADVWNVPTENLIAKSVFAPFCLEWLREEFDIQHVVWVRRSLLNVIASWFEYSSVKHPGTDNTTLLRRLTWQASQHYRAYSRLAQPGQRFYSVIIDHLDLIRDAEEGFPFVADQLGLKWTHEAMELMSDLNAAGVGGHYGLPGYSLSDHIRRSSEQLHENTWREKLNDDEKDVVMKELERWQ